jgi:hypothetical protein
VLDRARLSTTLAICVLLAAGCTAGCTAGQRSPEPVAQRSVAPEPVAPEPVVPEPAASTPAVDPQVVRAGVATLRRYLRVWETRGTIASGRFLVPRERPFGTDDGHPRLVSSQLSSYEVSTWDGPEHFVLQVELHRTFDGFEDPLQLAMYVHWDQNVPQPVTVRRTDRGRYLLSFASSP